MILRQIVAQSIGGERSIRGVLELKEDLTMRPAVGHEGLLGDRAAHRGLRDVVRVERDMGGPRDLAKQCCKQ